MNPGGKGIREMGQGYGLVVMDCVNCHNVLTFMAENADRIMAMPILPETGLPVDVQMVNGKPVPREFTDDELQRAQGNKKPMCLDCAERSARLMRARGFIPPEIDRRAYDIPA
jgi:hypothetical protein